MNRGGMVFMYMYMLWGSQWNNLRLWATVASQPLSVRMIYKAHISSIGEPCKSPSTRRMPQCLLQTRRGKCPSGAGRTTFGSRLNRYVILQQPKSPDAC
eukprot:316460-Amphidinium_carterae.1